MFVYYWFGVVFTIGDLDKIVVSSFLSISSYIRMFVLVTEQCMCNVNHGKQRGGALFSETRI